MLVEKVERINDDRWDTWVCIEPKCGIDYGDKEYEQIKQEILSIVNSCETDEFYNIHSGTKKYKYARYECECGNLPCTKEHWIIGNNEQDFTG